MIIGFIIIFATLFIDQLSKQLAYHLIAPTFSGTNTVLLKNVLELSYYENPGASLGILEGFAYKSLLFFVITVIALIIFGYLFKDSDFKHKKIYSISIALFISGTLGNAIDRALYGFVIDFLHYPFLDFLNNIPGISNFTNNMADNYLSAAIILFGIDLFFFESKRNKQKKDEQNAKIN
ncbi:signal peptidase II [Mariniplasma anaerobium]|uniref:Lipoprotein signal peptidase n=1 Tax=Mariniplasma anaerobium TaxID=2735436 RepID=A0A7U9TKS5_9MOLU|nr:signal peptidase II [Mariniplasma anaerobium]BCR35983.1 lipoprotein signal peptidase [Mariniplasma anaerobium]